MDAAHRAILGSLPPPPRRSKLEPYAALIRALRRRGRSYREIVGILQARCGLHVGTHTLYHFVRTRWSRATRRQVMVRDVPVTSLPLTETALRRPPDDAAVRRRIEALKRQPARVSQAPRAFAFNDEEPLALIRRPAETTKGRAT